MRSVMDCALSRLGDTIGKVVDAAEKAQGAKAADGEAREAQQDVVLALKTRRTSCVDYVVQAFSTGKR